MSDKPLTPAESEIPIGAPDMSSTEPDPALSAEQVLEQLKIELEQTCLAKDQNWERYLSAEADMQNLRRRTERDIANAHKFALERFVNELLPVVDSMELGLQSVSDTFATFDAERCEQIKEGMGLTLKMLQTTLEKFNVQVLNPLGEKLNPEWHQALTTQPSEQHETNVIMTVIQKGYLLNERLVRPALVIVAQ